MMVADSRRIQSGAKRNRTIYSRRNGDNVVLIVVGYFEMFMINFSTHSKATMIGKKCNNV